jgi:hypothetical protein
MTVLVYLMKKSVTVNCDGGAASQYSKTASCTKGAIACLSGLGQHVSEYAKYASDPDSPR